MGEIDKILNDNLRRTRFALMVEKAREKLREPEKKSIKLQSAIAKPKKEKIIYIQKDDRKLNSNVPLFSAATIEKYANPRENSEVEEMNEAR